MVLVLVTLVAAGCSRNAAPTAIKSPIPTPSPSPANLTWTDCGSGFQCATLQVPLDYAHPDAGTIGVGRVAMMRSIASMPVARGYRSSFSRAFFISASEPNQPSKRWPEAQSKSKTII